MIKILSSVKAGRLQPAAMRESPLHMRVVKLFDDGQAEQAKSGAYIGSLRYGTEAANRLRALREQAYQARFGDSESEWKKVCGRSWVSSRKAKGSSWSRMFGSQRQRSERGNVFVEYVFMALCILVLCVALVEVIGARTVANFQRPELAVAFGD